MWLCSILSLSFSLIAVVVVASESSSAVLHGIDTGSILIFVNGRLDTQTPDKHLLLLVPTVEDADTQGFT